MPTQTNNDDEYLGDGWFGIPVASYVNIKVHDILGNEVAIIVDEFWGGDGYDISEGIWSSLQSKPSGIYYIYYSFGDTVITRILHFFK